MRRYDLDWLRVGVFALLILYHVGMFFVPWGWHLKNHSVYSELTYPMLFVNQWRLPILFVISGMGTYYALGRRSGSEFAAERIRRLLIPLIAGILLVIPPQVYLERLYAGQFSGSYWEFWATEFFNGVYPEGNFSWHHLWFLPYLLVFSLLLAPLLIYLKKRPDHSLLVWIQQKITHPAGFYLFILPLYLFEALLEPFFPVTHALYNDWFSFVNYLFLFLAGFLLISAGGTFWESVKRNRKTYLFLAVSGFLSWLFLILLTEDSIYRHFSEALLKVFNLWSWILVLFGYAARYLNNPSPTLAYCNQAVYPFYILHQTVTLVLAYPLLSRELPFFPSFAYLVVGTFGISWLLYEFLIRRWGPLRLLFGLKPKGYTSRGYERLQKPLKAET